MKLKKVDALNDYVAVLKEFDVPEGVELDKDSADQFSNEGVVVGAGPDVNGVGLGDKVAFHPKRYLTIAPASGGYEDKIVIIARQSDLVVRIGKSDYEFEDE